MKPNIVIDISLPIRKCGKIPELCPKMLSANKIAGIFKM